MQLPIRQDVNSFVELLIYVTPIVSSGPHAQNSPLFYAYIVYNNDMTISLRWDIKAAYVHTINVHFFLSTYAACPFEFWSDHARNLTWCGVPCPIPHTHIPSKLFMSHGLLKLMTVKGHLEIKILKECFHNLHCHSQAVNRTDKLEIAIGQFRYGAKC